MEIKFFLMKLNILYSKSFDKITCDMNNDNSVETIPTKNDKI